MVTVPLAFAGALVTGATVATLLVALVDAVEAALALTGGADVAEAVTLDAVAGADADADAVTAPPPQAASSPTLTTLPKQAMTARRLKRVPAGTDDDTITFSFVY
jgi:hypothetical protein